MIVRELVAKLGFTVDDKGLKKAEGLLGKLKSHLFAIGTGAVATGLFALAKSAANYGDEVFKSAQKTGLAVDSFQKLSYAAELADVSNEEFYLGIAQLSKRLVDVADGGESSVDAFKAVGISVSDLKNKSLSSESVLLKVSDAFQKMQDGPRKTALAMDLFGKSGARLIPLLNSGSASIKELGSELEAMGGVMDEASAKRGEALNDSLTVLNRVFLSLKNTIGAELVPYITKAIEAFTKWVKENKGLIGQNLSDVVNTISVAFSVLWDMLSAGFSVFSKISKAISRSKIVLTAFKAILVGLAAAYVINGIYGLATAFKVLWAAIMSNPIIAIITAIIVVVIALIDDIAAYIQGRPSIFGIIVEWAKKAWDWIKDIFGRMWDWLKGVFEGIKNAISEELDAAWQDVQNIGKLIVDAFTSIWDGITSGIKGVADWFKWLWDKIDGLLGITDKLKSAWDGLLSAWEQVKRFFGAGGSDVSVQTTIDDVNKSTQAAIDVLSKIKEINTAQGLSDGSKAADFSKNPIASAIVASAAIPIAAATGGAGVQNTTQNNAFNMPVKVEVNVESTADPNEIGNIAAKAAATHLDGVLRSAAQNLESTVKN